MDNYRPIKWKLAALGVALCISAVVFSQTIKSFKVDGLETRPQVSAPAGLGVGRPGIYYNSGSNTFRQIDNAGSETGIGAGGGTVSSISQGTGITATPNPIVGTGSIALATFGAGAGSCTLCSVTVDATGRVSTYSAGVEADTLQTAYNDGSDITMSAGPEGVALIAYGGQTTPALPITRNAIAGGNYDAIVLENTTASVGATSPQNSPSLLLKGRGFRTEAPTGDQPDHWRIRSNPNFDQAGDTAHLELLHSYDGTNFNDGLRITTQDQLGTSGEVILETRADQAFCLYPHGTAGDAHGLLSFLCLDGSSFKFGNALSGNNRVQMTASVGLSPQVDNTIDLGQYDNGVFLWKQINGAIIRGHNDAIGTGVPSANHNLKVENNTAATVGAQKYSPPMTLIGAGWDTNTSSSRVCESSEQLVPVQETTAPPSIERRWSHRVGGIDADVVDLVLSTRGGGTIISQHEGGQGTAPTFTAGDAANCTTSASGISFATGASDKAGTFTFTTGTAVCPTGTIGTITFNKAYTTPPTVILYSANAAATVSEASARVFQANTTTTTFTMTQNTSGYLGATQFRYSYMVVQ